MSNEPTTPFDKLEGYKSEVEAVREKLDRQSAVIQNNATLSDQGKQAEYERAKAAAEAQAATIQEKAASDLQGRASAIENDLKRYHKEHADGLRAQLGETVYADLIRRQVESMAPAEVLEAFSGEFDPATKTLIGHYGALALKGTKEGERLARELANPKTEAAALRLRDHQTALEQMPRALNLYRREELQSRFKLN